MMPFRSSTTALTLVFAAIVAAACLATTANASSDDGGKVGSAWSWDDWGRQNQSAALADCLCWNTTSQNWCHSKHDGSNTGFWRHSCSRVTMYAYWWVVLVVFWVMFLFLFPLFFATFRMCCNCCGGRSPTYGCCCPISNRVISPDPTFTRKYSRCATWFAKILALCVFIAFLDVAIQGYIQNHKTTNVVSTATDAAQSAIGSMQGSFETIQLLELSNITRNSWFKIDIKKANKQMATYNRRVAQVEKVLEKVKHYDHKYRAGPVYKIISIPLTLITLVTILAFCNVRSWPVSISAGLISFLAAVLVLMASAVYIAYQTSNLMCDNIPIVEKLAKDVLKGQGCDISSITHDINTSQVEYVKYMCKTFNLDQYYNATLSGPKAHFFCNPVVGGMFTVNDSSFPGQVVVNNDKIRTSLSLWAGPENQLFTKSGVPPAICFFDGPKVCTDYNHIELLMTFSQMYTNDVLANLQPLFQGNYQCNIVSKEFNSQIMPNICGVSTFASTYFEDGYFIGGGNSKGTNNLPNALLKLGGILTGLGCIAMVAIFVYINGAKRFTKSATAEEMQAHHTHHFQSYNGAAHHDAYPAQYAAMGEVEKGAAPAPEQQQQQQQQQQYQTPAVAGTMAQPLLLSHEAPNYSGTTMADDASVNPDQQAKAQPEPL